MQWFKISILYLLVVLQILQTVQGKKKIVKLIVPHNIKYIHHTHVLLIKPKKKKKAHVSEDIEDDSEGYDYHHITLPKRKLRYVPYSAEEKEGHYMSKKPHMEQYSPYYHQLEGQRTHKIPEENHSTNSKRSNYHRPLAIEHKPQVFHYPPYDTSYTAEEAMNKYVRRPAYMQSYNNKYMGAYDSIPEMDPAGLVTEETRWGDGSYEIPERLSYRKNSYMTVPELGTK